MISAAASAPSRPQVVLSATAREAREKPARKDVARAGRVDEPGDREGGDLPLALRPRR